MKKFIIFIFIFMLAVVSAGCLGGTTPTETGPTLEEIGVVGTWVVTNESGFPRDFSSHNSAKMFTFFPDGTFREINAYGHHFEGTYTVNRNTITLNTRMFYSNGTESRNNTYARGTFNTTTEEIVFNVFCINSANMITVERGEIHTPPQQLQPIGDVMTKSELVGRWNVVDIEINRTQDHVSVSGVPVTFDFRQNGTWRYDTDRRYFSVGVNHFEISADGRTVTLYTELRCLTTHTLNYEPLAQGYMIDGRIHLYSNVIGWDKAILEKR